MMSVWYVNDVWRQFDAVDLGEVHWVDCSDVASTLNVETTDVLSHPEVETLEPAALALWPRGAAWGAPGLEAAGEGTVLAQLTRAVLSPFCALYSRAWQLTLESRASTLVDSLDDWEADHGLPDRCVSEPQTIEQRKTSLLSRVAREATITPGDMVRLAAKLGFVVALEEPEPFRFGETSLGDGELSDVALGQQWVMHIHDAPTWRFEVGISEVGTDRLLDFDTGVIECAIQKVAPAWTMPIFSAAPLPELFELLAEGGAPITTEAGSTIIAVHTPSE